jgi:hypothetical protein
MFADPGNFWDVKMSLLSRMMKNMLTKHSKNSGHWLRHIKVPVAIRGFPKKTLFRLYAADNQANISLFNEEFDMGNATTFYFYLEIPSHVRQVLIRCRDSSSKFQCWEEILSVQEAAKKGVSIDVRPAGFGKSLGETLRRID